MKFPRVDIEETESCIELGFCKTSLFFYSDCCLISKRVMHIEELEGGEEVDGVEEGKLCSESESGVIDGAKFQELKEEKVGGGEEGKLFLGSSFVGLDAKRALVGAGGRALFYPTLFYNVVRNKLQAEFRWWDQVDEVYSYVIYWFSFHIQLYQTFMNGWNLLGIL